jgi:DDE superfamily endonuclease
LWVSGPLPGTVHDLNAARIWGIVRGLVAAGLVVLAEKGYHGAGDHIRTPYKGKNKPPAQKAANCAHAKLRSPGERATPSSSLKERAVSSLKERAVSRRRVCPGL